MVHFKKYRKLNLALLFWSALFVYSCASKTGVKDESILRPTMVSENLDIKNFQDGKLTYKFVTPEMVQYKNKDTSYMVFAKGIHIITYDSLGVERTWLRANYAVFRESIPLWEARDSVVAQDKDGKILKTNLLFWNQQTKRIYSTLRTVVLSGDEIVVGENGFESDEELNNIEFKQSKGRILVDTTQNTQEVDTLGIY